MVTALARADICWMACEELCANPPEEAIRKMTSQPADRLGIADRGLLRKGLKSDLIVFNPAKVSDTSTYAKPGQSSKGLE